MITIEEFKAGTQQKGYDYTYFLPTHIHDQWSWKNAEINNLLEKAAAKLGELNAYARFVPNIDLFIQLHVTKEAVVSSQIEGTRTNIDEALLPLSEIQPERRDDWSEVNNYIEAMNAAINHRESLPLSSRLIRNTHQILLQGVRGEHKLPGEFRRSQNWIGGRSLADATFIPPRHDHVQHLMSDLEYFLHDEKIPALIRIAIAHYQFETIHPFLDGNGRIGRLMITLFLVNAGILTKPLLYLSSYFEADRGLYYDNLMNVRTRNNLLQWIKYFLVGLELTAAKAIDTLTSVLDLKSKTEQKIEATFGRRSKSGIKLLQYLLEHPIVTVEDAKTATDLSFKAANDLVQLMERKEILSEMTGQSRNRMFQFNSYIDAFR